MQKKSQSIDFEKSLKKLEKIVQTMEQGNLSLEESLQQFEQGVTLTRQCQQILKAAEQKVKILTNNEKLEDYQNDTE